MQRLYIGGLGHTVSEKDLRDRFGKFGEVSDVEIITRKDEQGSPLKTFAYVNINISDAEYKRCTTALNKSKWKGGTLQIEVAKESFLHRLAEERKQASEKAETPKPDPQKTIVESLKAAGVENFHLKAAVPGTEIPGHKNWVVSKFGRVLPVLHLKCQEKSKVFKYDPSKHCHRIKKLKTEEGFTPVSQLTWEIDGGYDEISKRRRGEFPPQKKTRKITNTNLAASATPKVTPSEKKSPSHIENGNVLAKGTRNLFRQKAVCFLESDADSDDEIRRLVAQEVSQNHTTAPTEVVDVDDDDGHLEVVGDDFQVKSNMIWGGGEDGFKNLASKNDEDYDSADTDELLTRSKNQCKSKKVIEPVTNGGEFLANAEEDNPKKGKEMGVVNTSCSESSASDESSDESIDSEYEALISNCHRIELSITDLEHLVKNMAEEESDDSVTESQAGRSELPEMSTFSKKPSALLQSKSGNNPEDILASLFGSGLEKDDRISVKSSLPAFVGTKDLFGPAVAAPSGSGLKRPLEKKDCEYIEDSKRSRNDSSDVEKQKSSSLQKDGLSANVDRGRTEDGKAVSRSAPSSQWNEIEIKCECDESEVTASEKILSTKEFQTKVNKSEISNEEGEKDPDPVQTSSESETSDEEEEKEVNPDPVQTSSESETSDEEEEKEVNPDPVHTCSELVTSEEEGEKDIHADSVQSSSTSSEESETSDDEEEKDVDQDPVQRSSTSTEESETSDEEVEKDVQPDPVHTSSESESSDEQGEKDTHAESVQSSTTSTEESETSDDDEEEEDVNPVPVQTSSKSTEESEIHHEEVEKDINPDLVQSSSTSTEESETSDEEEEKDTYSDPVPTSSRIAVAEQTSQKVSSYAKAPEKPGCDAVKQQQDNQKRIAALEQRQKEAEQQKKLIQGALSKLDVQNPNKGKHIMFDSDDDDDDDDQEHTTTRKKSLFEEESDEESQAEKHQDIKEKEFEKKKAAKLFDCSDDDDDHGSEGERFRIKPQYEGKAGQKLLQLQSRFGADPRFQMDAKFLESDGESEEQDAGHPPMTEEQELAEEKKKNMDILESVLNDRNLPHKASKELTKAQTFRDVSALHYDPTSEAHAAFETKIEPAKKESKAARRKKRAEAETLPEVSKEIYYDVTVDLKDVFGGSKEEQKEKEALAWDKIDDDDEEEEEEEKEEEMEEAAEEETNTSFSFKAETEKDTSSGFKFSFFGDDPVVESEPKMDEYKPEALKMAKLPWQVDPRFRDSSSDEEDMEEDEEKEDEEEKKEDKSQSATTAPNTDQTQTRSRFFFYEGDIRLKEGPKMFCRTEKLEDLRQAWEERRAELRDDFRRKHRDARRHKPIKKH